MAAFMRAQEGIRVARVSLDIRLTEGGQIDGKGELVYRTNRKGSRFLLDPRLQLREVTVDGCPAHSTRAGALVQFSDTPGEHLLGARWTGAIPSDGGLGLSNSSFDLNLNLLWYPTLLWGSRFDVQLVIRLPRGAKAVLPTVARRGRQAVSMQSVIDVPMVGGRIRGARHGRGLSVYSLVRRDVSEFRRTAERVVEWLEGKWGPRPFRPIRFVETWRQQRGAYAREGLIVTPDWSQAPEQEVAQRLVHEAAHQWWGMDALPGEAWFAEDWLSEGLATYCEYLWRKERVGGAAAYEFREMATKEIRGMRGSLAELSPWSREGWNLSRYGALLVLVELERRVPNLVKTLRRYRARHHGSFVTTKSLIRELRGSVPESWLESHLVSERSRPGYLESPRS